MTKYDHLGSVTKSNREIVSTAIDRDSLAKLMKAMNSFNSVDPEVLKRLQQSFDQIRQNSHQAIHEFQKWKDAWGATESEAMKKFQVIIKQHENFKEFISGMNQKALLFQKVIEGLGKIASPFNDFLEESAKMHLKAMALKGTGWLPHYSTPFALLERVANKSDFDEAMIDYYSNNWDVVDQQFRKSISSHSIDDEARLTFEEALRSHKAGNFRVAPRLLFPEIERVVRAELYDGKHSTPSTNGKSTPGIASLKEIRKVAGKLPAGEIWSYDFGIELFKIFESHIYERVEEGEANIAKYVADPIPNRHAALHGFVSYSTAQSSLNALIMTDFIFHVISKIKMYQTDRS